jgi:mannose-1-phosphate guanylyltransferase
MKHVSEYESEEWLNARDRRRSSRKGLDNNNDSELEKAKVA